MRERISHRYRRITGRIAVWVAAWLLVLPAALSTLTPAGAGARADDNAANQAGIQVGVQATNAVSGQSDNRGDNRGDNRDDNRDDNRGDNRRYNRGGTRDSEDADQLFILGQNRESGEWVRPNPVEAYMWYLLAAMAGHDRAPTARERIAADMTVEQIAAAWSRAGRCLATGYLYCDEGADP